MENSNNYSAEELQKCPYHSQENNSDKNNEPQEKPNTGDWGDIDEDDEAGTDPNRYESGNDNSGGSGSTGSAATNS
ncbi:hypothetical protein [Flavobacterium pectinovorum]|uniref:Uncharacterized protein n=1 Tax=Flavobacterium pectinovorum TaxID=29533 RepID=A0A502E929_9FLAO|nr:hypothetical protein [Flavobacterium pectinovorum]TPG33907.1 hypothetical protein EAH81_23450 [Flavobacterium pectinovorum]